MLRCSIWRSDVTSYDAAVFSKANLMSRENPPVRPRDAASLVIFRRRTPGASGDLARDVEVLVGRRSAHARFKPDTYVFPGGGLERADHRVRPVSALAADVVARLAVAGSPARAHALALAAIRETWEEVGLMFGAPGDIGENPSASWQAFRCRGLAPALDRLTYLGRAITPSPQPIRFHARFFAAEIADLHGDPRPSRELSDVQWVSLADTARLHLMPVTLLMLDALKRRLATQDTRTAFLSFQHGRRQIRWV